MILGSYALVAIFSYLKVTSALEQTLNSSILGYIVFLPTEVLIYVNQ